MNLDRGYGKHAFAELLGRSDHSLGSGRVAATHRREEDVLVEPDHALGKPGRAARVGDVTIVGAASLEVAGGRRSRQRVLVRNRRVRDRSIGAVLHDDEVLQRAHARRDGLDLGTESPVEHQGHHAGVHEDLLELACHVAVVDVDRYRAQLERREHPLEVLGAVHQQEPDGVIGAHPRRGEMVRETVGPFLELGVGQLAPGPDDDRGTIADLVGHHLEEVGEVVRHHGQPNALLAVKAPSRSTRAVPRSGRGARCRGSSR